MACDRVLPFFPLVPDGSLTPDSIHHEGRVGSWRNMEPYRLYLIIYRVSNELRSLLRESVPYVKLYRYNPKHLYPNLNGLGDSGKRKVWTS
jgi:hypothetical protein